MVGTIPRSSRFLLDRRLLIDGFTGLDLDVTKGYEKIRVTFRIKSEASAEQLAELARMSPVYNTIVNPTPVEIAIEKA